jgi:hypothetical protein
LALSSRGRIVIAGAVAPAKPLPVFKNRNFCGRQVTNETLIVGRDGGVKNAVVILRALRTQGSRNARFADTIRSR